MASKPDPNNGPCVLGIDAAWTAHQPSGIALVQRSKTGWSCLAVARSYEAFIIQASSQPWDPQQKATGSRPDPAALLQASKLLTGAEVSCVSVDMPLATTPITRNRPEPLPNRSSGGTRQRHQDPQPTSSSLLQREHQGGRAEPLLPIKELGWRS